MNYLNDDIVFLTEDSEEQKLTKTVHLFAGSHELKKELKKQDVSNYTKVYKGLSTIYILRSQKIGRLIVTL